MAKNSKAALFTSLDSLLDEEQSALLRGDLGAISDLVSRKEKLFERLNDLGERPQEGLEGLRKKTLRNQALLDAALDGIRSVSERMSALRRVRDSLETYDNKGQRLSVRGRESSSVERRA